MNITGYFFDKYYLKSFCPQTKVNPTLQEVKMIIDNPNFEKDVKIMIFACGYGKQTIEFYYHGFSNIARIDYNASPIEMVISGMVDLIESSEYVNNVIKEFDKRDQYDLIYCLFTSIFNLPDHHNLNSLSIYRSKRYNIDSPHQIYIIRKQE